jgi:hypothetical protein
LAPASLQIEACATVVLMKRVLVWSSACLVAALLAGADVHAQTVEVTAFGGYGFGGSLLSPVLDREVPIEGGVVYGGIADVTITPRWQFEALYSRQESRIEGASPGVHLGLDVERYMAGVREHEVWGRVRLFGTFLVGATRFVPSGFESETWFTLGIGLGVTAPLGTRIGLRVEARGFYIPVNISGTVICVDGRCLFGYSGSGLFQGDVSGGITFAF